MRGSIIMNNRLPGDKWIKASIAGTIWAASEIVLGGFLHNLRIPFSGNILTAIGIIILVSISYVWREKGIFWRAGLICALMKTMSPSAVIFGPMIAIFSESMLLEVSTRLLGRTAPGYLLGSMLAMAWNLFHRIANLIIFYGFNIVELYENLLGMARKQLNIEMDIVWLPILFLLLVYSLFGIAAGVIGIRVGRRLLTRKEERIQVPETVRIPVHPKKKRTDFPYSLAWLVADTSMLVGALILITLTRWIFWVPAIMVVVLIWATRYKRAMRQISKPGFWVFFIILTMITAFIWVDVPPGTNRWVQGLLIGIEMNFRAVVVVLGFSVLGTELYNPKIREFFMKTWFRQLPMALELAVTSLPSMISAIPEWKILVKSPVSVFYGMISGAENRLEEIRKSMERKVILITGSIGQGKTTFVKFLAERMKHEGMDAGGICSPRIMEGTSNAGYMVEDIASGETVLFLRRTPEGGKAEIGRYQVVPEGLKAGLKALDPELNRMNRAVIIDEVGKLELDGQGWSKQISRLLLETNCHLILCVRDSFAGQVIRKWNLDGCIEHDVSLHEMEKASEQILEKIR